MHKASPTWANTGSYNSGGWVRQDCVSQCHSSSKWWNKSILQTGSLHRKRLLEKVGKFQEEVESNDLKSQDIRQSLKKFQAVKSKWKGGCGSAEFTIHTSVQCCEVWACLAWGDELNCYNKRIVGQWQVPLRQTRNWDQESKGGSAVGDQECSIRRHRSMREYPGSLINFDVMWYMPTWLQ